MKNKHYLLYASFFQHPFYGIGFALHEDSDYRKGMLISDDLYNNIFKIQRYVFYKNCLNLKWLSPTYKPEQNRRRYSKGFFKRVWKTL